MNRKTLFATLITGFLALTLVAFFVLTGAPIRAHAATASLTATNFCGAQPNDANCDGQAPEAQGCTADAITIASVPVVSGNQTLGQVLLLYSRNCRSSWARTESSFSATLSSQILRSDGLSYSNTQSNVTKVHTVMIFASKPLRACGSINGVSACTQ